MEPQNPAYLQVFLESVNAFINSSQSLDINFLSEIASLLNMATTTMDNNVRTQKEKELENLKRSMDWKNYVLSLFQIAYFSQNLNQTNLEQILSEASSHIFKESSYNMTSTQELMVLLAANICCMVNKEFPVSVRKKYLSRSLENLLRIEMQDKDRIKETLDYYSISSLGTASHSQAFSHILILRQLIFEGSSLKDYPLQKIEFYLHQISQLGLNVLTQNQILTSASPEDLVYIIEITQMMCEICLFLVERSLSENTVVEDADDQHVLKNDPNFHKNSIFQASPLYKQILELLDKVLDINFSESPIKLLSLSPNHEFNVYLNRAKKHSIQTINLIVFNVFNFKKLREHSFSQEETNIINQFIKKFEEYLKFSLTQLHEVTIGLFSSNTAPSYDQMDLLHDVVILLTDLVCQYEYYTIFLDNRKEVVVNIILNFLLTTKGEYQELIDNARDFTLLEQDMISKRESDTLKTCVADFLYKFCEKIDGTLSWVAVFLIKSIHMSIGQEDDYTDLMPFQQSIFLASVDPKNRIESSLLGLLILSDLIKQRVDLVKNLDQLLRSDFELLLQIDSNLLKCRLCLFMQQMLPNLFLTNTNFFTQAVTFLFDCLVDFSNKALSLQALSSLELLIRKKEEFERIEGVVFELLTYLEKIINQANEPSYFEFLIKFILTYKEKISRYTSNFIKLFTLRIWREATASNLLVEKRDIILHKSLQAICKIVSFREIVDESFKSFEEDLEKLFCLLDQTTALNIEEDLFAIATEIAKNTNFNSIIYAPIQRNLLRVLHRADDTIDIFFDLFYYWSTNGNQFISQENGDLLKGMVEACLASIESFPVQSLGAEFRHFSEACLCLQVIIQCFDKDQLATMINDILARLDRIEKQLCSDEMRLIGFRFFQIYFCLISFYPTETLRHLSQTELLYVLLEKIPYFYLEYFPDDIYSRKVISIGLISLFHNRTSACPNENLTRACFVNLIKVLRYNPIEVKDNRNTTKPKKPEETKQQDLTSNEVLTLPKFPLAMDNNVLCAKIKTLDLPIMRKEEYQLFTKIYDQFKEFNAQFNEAMMMLLDSEMQASLKLVLSTKNYVEKDTNQVLGRKQITVKKKFTNPIQNNPVLNFQAPNLMGNNGGNFLGGPTFQNGMNE